MKQTLSQILVDRIVFLCGKRSLSINQLAEMSGVRQSTLNSLMHGESQNPTARTLFKLAAAFSMTPAEFLDFPELNEYSFEDQFDE